MDAKRRLLIVDDELLIRDLLYDYFAGCDYDISIADDGQGALDLMEKTHFDTVILDIKMPDMDGLEVADRIRADDDRVPIIFMTGFPSIDTAVAALRRHADDYFIKPFNVKHMHKSVQAAIARAADTGRADSAHEGQS
jgi:DNA-binding response OmpR family regulator